MKNPIREIFDFKKQELPVVVLLFLFFFMAIAVFQMLYPLKKGLFIEHYGADIELYAKFANILVAAIGVIVFTFLYNRVSRQRVIYIFCFFFIGCFLLMTNVITETRPLPIWGFYLLGDLVTTLMVASFWAYATDISTTSQAKRLFGVIGGGGIVGGLVGSTLTRILLPEIGTQGLLFLGVALMAMIILVTYLTESLIPRSGSFLQATTRRSPEKKVSEKKTKTSAAIEGAQLVMRSKYLAAIVGIMAFYEMASQVVDYQFSSLTEGISGETETLTFVANVRFYANALSVFVQFFLVSLIMRRLGLVVALLVLPLAIFCSSVAFFAVSTLVIASLLHISDNGLNYSIQQTARESLYVVTTPDEKYKARAFTNMFVQRLAKGLSILLVIGIGLLNLELRFLSALTIFVVILMALCGIYAGRQFAHKSKLEESQH
jgi:AAA family ATP:ADP antiporter